MVELVKEFASGIYNLILGMFTTTKHLGRHAITIQYPKERWEIPERSRGMVVLLTDLETGKLNCTGCLLCMKACPSAAISIEVVKDENKKRHVKSFDLNYNICCFCGLCEESCNFAAIKLATKFEFPAWDKKDFQWDIAKLQEMGLDVPYEKPVKKKKAVKKPVVKKPAEDKPAEAKPEDKAEVKTEVKTEDKPAEAPKAEEKPAEEAKPEVTAEDKPAEPKPDEKPADESADKDKKEGEG
ncbi:MAG: 4Fe-4S dicluster domain-containing protein [candidate division Zixibacteria bacterium]|nr:4Fe-4S dicluster domain-containing protein [candidate division Zixibacteria bacterium]